MATTEVGRGQSRPKSTRAGGSSALRFVVLVGVMSLFADAAYEGARSINGPYLALLGASATAVGIIAGGGELLGYALRLASGRLADTSRQFWRIAIVGYVVQMAAVPALALAGSWQLAALLIVAERIGKGLRNPPRDAMLARATAEMGRGWGFGLHEALDQTGALVGPLAAAAVLAAHGDYRLAFAMLAIPAALTLVTLAIARVTYPNPSDLAAKPADFDRSDLPGGLWLYLAAVGLVAAGFADFSLMAFHFARAGIVSDHVIPLFYAGAMAAAGLGSLIVGRAFDRLGIVVLVPLTVAAALSAPLVFLGAAGPAFLGTLLWGLGMGVHESIMSAAVANMVPTARTASAIGLFNLVFGVAWFVGSAAMGILYDVSILALVGFSVVVEVLAAVLLWRTRSATSRPTASSRG